MCACLLTGCSQEDQEEVFGKTGTYILDFGRDVFGTGIAGAFGENHLSEPQSNESDEILINFDVKGTEAAPKTEKSEYDYSGPINDGIPVIEDETAVPEDNSIDTGDSNSTGTSSGGPVVVLSSGHVNGGNNDLECCRLVTYGVAATDLVMQFRSDKDVKTESFKIPKIDKGKKELAANICGKKKGAVTRDELIKKLIDLKIIKTAKKSNDQDNFDGNTKFKFVYQKGKTINYEKYYEKGHESFDKEILDFLNENDGSALADWASKLKWQSGVTPSAKWTSGSLSLFKAKATTGGSYKDIDEYELNWATTLRLKTLLEKDGYTVVLTRSKKEDQTLNNGEAFSNRNMSLYAGEQKDAVIHLMLHWDSSSKWIHCLTGKEDTVGGSAAKIAEAVSDEIEKSQNAKKKLVKKVDSLHNSLLYTGLNWQSIPTIELECGVMNDADVGRFVSNGKFDAKSFWEGGRYKIVKEGIKVAVKEAGMEEPTLNTSGKSNGNGKVVPTTFTQSKDLKPKETGQKAMKERFEQFVYLFKACEKAYGVPASVSIAQFIQESRAGVEGVVTSSNNAFGMKKGSTKNLEGSTWDGKSMYKGYRKYDCIEDSIIDHAVRLAKSDIYDQDTEKYKNGELTVEEYIDAIANPYCEDPDRYARILKKHIKTYELKQYDKK